MRLIVIVSLCALIAGCAAATRWERHGASEQDFLADQYSCNRDMAAQPMWGGFAVCMRAHGWRAQ